MNNYCYFCVMKQIIIIFAILFPATLVLAQSGPENKHKKDKGVSTANFSQPTMVVIPRGVFMMGSTTGDADETPVHSVTISEFRIGSFEVTYKQFSDFVEQSGYRTDAEKTGYSHIFTTEWTTQNGITWRDNEQGHPRGTTDMLKPVCHVSWNDAMAYCAWLSKKTGKNYRLPTEAEWEYAAGNGTRHSRFSWGDKIPDAKKKSLLPELKSEKVVVCSSKLEKDKNDCFNADDVGTYLPNDFGVYDMSGNVWEWCGDWYGVDYYSKSAGLNPRGPVSGFNRVIRGANWVYYPEKGTVTYRTEASPTLTNYNIGFRVVCED